MRKTLNDMEFSGVPFSLFILYLQTISYMIAENDLLKEFGMLWPLKDHIDDYFIFRLTSTFSIRLYENFDVSKKQIFADVFLNCSVPQKFDFLDSFFRLLLFLPQMVLKWLDPIHKITFAPSSRLHSDVFIHLMVNSQSAALSSKMWTFNINSSHQWLYGLCETPTRTQTYL